MCGQMGRLRHLPLSRVCFASLSFRHWVFNAGGAPNTLTPPRHSHPPAGQPSPRRPTATDTFVLRCIYVNRFASGVVEGATRFPSKAARRANGFQYLTLISSRYRIPLQLRQQVCKRCVSFLETCSRFRRFGFCAPRPQLVLVWFLGGLQAHCGVCAMTTWFGHRGLDK